MLNSILGAQRLRLYVWASLVSQILIVVTGGAVRLTGSGLGCPTWPECEPGSYTTVPELGIHGIIEFANRLLTFVLLIVAILTYLTILRLAKNERNGLIWPAFALGFGIVIQAVIGGITVLAGLNAWIVGAHFLVSAVLIGIATILVWRFYGNWSFETNQLSKRLTPIIFYVGLVAIIIGIIVTGSGPHAGDSETPRNGLNSDFLVHIHSYPAYLLLALVLLQTILYFRARNTPQFAKKINLGFLGIIAIQAGVGILQARIGLPIELVALHMFGASVLASMLTLHLLITRNLLHSK
ncbi:MAG: heme A synthase [Rhodoluna sp.]|nr:heme A synthase [Rhodoluna sp.]